MYKLFKTASFRLTFLIVIFLVFTEIIIGVLIYQRVFALYVQQNDQVIIDELYLLSGVSNLKEKELIPKFTISTIFGRLQRRMYNTGLVYILSNIDNEVILANISHIPSEAKVSNKFFNFTIKDDRTNDLETSFLTFRGIYFQAKTPDGKPYFNMMIAYDNSQIANLRVRLINDIILISIITILLGIISGVIISKLILTRIERISSQLNAIIYNNVSGRLTINNTGDELDFLTQQINQALDKLEKLMLNIREVGDNIAHDLRSPLSRLKNTIDQIGKSNDQIGKSKNKEQAILINKSKDELEGILNTFSAMLSISRLKAGEGIRNLESIDLEKTINAVYDLYEPLLTDSKIKFYTQYNINRNINASKELISQVFANLFENVLKYAKGAKCIQLTVTQNDKNYIKILFADDGPGIKKEYYGKILERFFRLDKSRHIKGMGLGLAWVSAIIKAHDGDIKVVSGLNNQNGGSGLAYVIELWTDK